VCPSLKEGLLYLKLHPNLKMVKVHARAGTQTGFKDSFYEAVASLVT